MPDPFAAYAATPGGHADPFAAYAASEPPVSTLELAAKSRAYRNVPEGEEPPQPGLINRMVQSDAAQGAAHPQTLGDVVGLMTATLSMGGTAAQKTLPALGRAASAVGSLGSTGLRALRTVGSRGLTTVGNALDSDLVGVLSPRLSHAGGLVRTAGKIMAPAESAAPVAEAAAPAVTTSASVPFKALPGESPLALSQRMKAEWSATHGSGPFQPAPTPGPSPSMFREPPPSPSGLPAAGPKPSPMDPNYVPEFTKQQAAKVTGRSTWPPEYDNTNWHAGADVSTQAGKNAHFLHRSDAELAHRLAYMLANEKGAATVSGLGAMGAGAGVAGLLTPKIRDAILARMTAK